MLASPSTFTHPQRMSIGFLPNQREHNFSLFKKLIELLPDRPLKAPISEMDPALSLEQALLKFAEIYANIRPECFIAGRSKNLQGLTPYEAFSCLRDVVRTKKFLQAIESIIESAHKDKNIVHVLDAGCGPFAVLGLFAALVSEKVHCTCLEVEPSSAIYARVFVEKMGLADRVKIILADATRFVPADEIKYDLIISETMFSAFLDEPIVEILNHLVRFKAENGQTLPGSIDYMVGASEIKGRVEGEKLQYGSERNVAQEHGLDSWEKLFTWKPGDCLEQINFNARVPEHLEGDFNLYVGCDVHLDHLTLSKFDSNLSRPIPLKHKSGELIVCNKEHGRFRVNYLVGVPAGLVLGSIFD